MTSPISISQPASGCVVRRTCCRVVVMYTLSAFESKYPEVLEVTFNEVLDDITECISNKRDNTRKANKKRKAEDEDDSNSSSESD